MKLWPTVPIIHQLALLFEKFDIFTAITASSFSQTTCGAKIVSYLADNYPILPKQTKLDW